MIEFGLSRCLSQIVTVTDLRMERILRRAGWPLVRVGDPYTSAPPAPWPDISTSPTRAGRCPTKTAVFMGRYPRRLRGRSRRRDSGELMEANRYIELDGPIKHKKRAVRQAA
ncbi:acyl-homoserine-lactone synthase [Mesorhizobium sp. L103C131B0]|uniref:acyl-homoserine-lactone synthase n=1 Tax=Mesorhizobium sp. L103C131B0 TaxID=1287089 RepID=UPI001FD97710|nr:acyl-homoserine-lactone synthase [Mesorhizobium sp. L103C131B0]